MEQVTSIPTPKTKPFPSHFKNTVTVIVMVASIFDPSTPEGASLVCRASARTAEATPGYTVNPVWNSPSLH